MASVDWMKLKTGGMRHLAVHFQQELRETKDHSNRNINKELTKNNVTFGVKDFYEACDKMDARIKEVDEKYPPKRRVDPKERVVGCSLNVVCPPEIAALGTDKVVEYFKTTYEKMEDYFGKDNLCGGFVHLDETHTYKDAETKEDRESLFHMNVFVVSFVDEEVTTKPTKKNPSGKSHVVGINGKHFQSRKHMNEVNQKMEDICKEYGVKWQNGKGKNHETIESMKAKSAQIKRELLEQDVAELNQKKSELMQENSEIQEQVDNGKMDVSNLAVESAEIQEQIDKGKEELNSIDYLQELSILDRFFMFIERSPASQRVVDWLREKLDEFEKEDSKFLKNLGLYNPRISKKQKNIDKNHEVDR